ncbi:SusC/RagA family TonB-linked outer membrane protein [Flavilitoribacter nigricans DSM 23189 = NBRC 102662]|uniref:SusC/RagA family TonB-linked outer membrane protein n=2 Tax=Flavilitoribacter TaxID=2762562 RepID=A0A2D0N2Z2_FLAN2|nr:SusC/RagA family TonB-linked outer membrane protein [Flavilitoribacter nigricans DSM 23189 = NBRC 102662]
MCLMSDVMAFSPESNNSFPYSSWSPGNGPSLATIMNIPPPAVKPIDGVITDEDGEPLAGATVQVRGTEVGTITDIDGRFSLSADEGAVLVVSYLGYVTQEVVVGSESSLEIKMASDATVLEDVVVIAYGSQKKEDVTGAVGSVNSEDFNRGVVVNPGQLLQGKVAGVNVSSVSGEPGAAQNVIIRGVGSLRSGTTPLYVIDGFVIDNASTGVATNPLNFISPQDIESINVLKDASATALYGARAANGVVVITTRKGQTGRTEMNLSVSTAWSSLANKIDVFSADEFRRQVPAAGGTLFDGGGNTDWQDELTQTGISNRVHLSMGGAASEKFGYFISAGYDKQEGIFNNSTLERYSGRVNLNQTAINGRLKIDYNLTGARTFNARPDAGSMALDMLRLNPTIPSKTGNDATLLDGILNPLARNQIYKDEASNNRILANISPSFEIARGFSYKLNLGVDYSNTDRIIQLNPYALLEGLDLGSLTSITAKNNNNLVENTFTYLFEQGEHGVTLLAGHSYQKTFEQQKVFSLTGFANNGIEPVYQDQISTQEQPTNYSAYAIENELQSFFGRVNYNFASKYLVTLTMRADGSSKFGENNKYGYFPSLALGWNLSNEDFMAGGAFDNLKLRASWGQTGNQEIPSKITQASFTESKANNDTYPLDPNASTLDDYPYGSIFTRLANPDIQWEVSTQTNIGVDFGLFDYRLTGTLDYFDKRSENVLLEVVPADPIQPTATYWTNVPDMVIKNSGFELTLDYNSGDRSAFTYNIGGNLAYTDNKVENSPFAVLTTGAAQGAGQTGATINGYLNGYAIGSFYMKEFAGIGEDGLNRFKDQNGDGQVLENDRIVVGSALPDLLYAFYVNFGYKQLDLRFNFNGVAGNEIYNHTAMSIFNRGNLASSFNTTDFAVEYDNEAITNSNEVSTRYLEDGSFLRLNNATISYTLLPADLGVGDWFSSVKISLTGQNLFTFTNYSGFDPEVNTGSSISGIQTFGIDRFTYPTARTILLGLNVAF